MTRSVAESLVRKCEYQFEADWNGSFRSALTRLNDAFDAAGQDCVVRTQELRRVMGAR